MKKKLIFSILLSCFIAFWGCSDSSDEDGSGNGGTISIGDGIVKGIITAGACNSGNGSAENPYVICTAADLENIGTKLASHYVLKQDIDVSSRTQWKAIGSRTDPFTGTFNGNGHKITGLTANKQEEANNMAVFGYIDNGSVWNLGVIIAPAGLGGRNYVAGVAGRVVSSTIANCYVKGNISGHNSVGGIAGEANGTILRNVFFEGNISSSGLAGGITGRLSDKGAVRDAYFKGELDSQNVAGGIVGEAYNAAVTNCFTVGDIIGTDTSSTRFGGIVGNSDISTVKHNVALTARVIGRDVIDRIAGYVYQGDVADNLAFAGMVLFGQRSWNKGDDVSSTDAAKMNTYINLGWRFGSSPEAPWVANEGGQPKLYFAQ